MVECNLPKVEVAGSNPVSRSNKNKHLCVNIRLGAFLSLAMQHNLQHSLYHHPLVSYKKNRQTDKSLTEQEVIKLMTGCLAFLGTFPFILQAGRAVSTNMGHAR